MKFRRGNDIPPFALNGFKKNSRHFLGRDTPLKEIFSNPTDTGSAATGILPMMIRTAVAIGVRNMGDPGDERGKPPFVDHFACREREGAHGPPMKSAEKGQNPRPFGMVTCQFKSCLNGFGA